jgi:hypothetical protein
MAKSSHSSQLGFAMSQTSSLPSSHIPGSVCWAPLPAPARSQPASVTASKKKASGPGKTRRAAGERIPRVSVSSVADESRFRIRPSAELGAMMAQDSRFCLIFLNQAMSVPCPKQKKHCDYGNLPSVGPEPVSEI